MPRPLPLLRCRRSVIRGPAGFSFPPIGPNGAVMVPMAETDQPFDALAGFHVVALVETARGVIDAQHMTAHPEVDALALRSADLQLDLGSHETDDGAGVFEDLPAFARANLLIAGRAHGVPVIDSVHPGVNDDECVRRAAAVASAYGLDDKLAIHPKQIDIIRSAFASIRAVRRPRRLTPSRVQTRIGSDARVRADSRITMASRPSSFAPGWASEPDREKTECR